MKSPASPPHFFKLLGTLGTQTSEQKKREPRFFFLTKWLCSLQYQQLISSWWSRDDACLVEFSWSFHASCVSLYRLVLFARQSPVSLCQFYQWNSERPRFPKYLLENYYPLPAALGRYSKGNSYLLTSHVSSVNKGFYCSIFVYWSQKW